MQALGALTVADFLAQITEPLIKLEIYVGSFSPFSGWTRLNTAPPGKRYSADVSSLDKLIYGGGWVDAGYLFSVNEKLLESLAYSLAGAQLSPAPIAGTWDAKVFNKDMLFFPRHPTSSYTTVFQVGRPARLSIGLRKNGVEYYFQQIIGVVAKSDFTGRLLEVMISGQDYTQTLSDTKLKSPNTYWGATDTQNTAGGTLTYTMPVGSTGVYMVYLAGTPLYNGNDWTYNAATRVLTLLVDPGGIKALASYYFTAQAPENIIADLLVAAGRYADRATALANMDYTATGITIDRVFFPSGNSALYSIGQICERLNYRFYFKYNGKPVFKPFPTAKAPGLEDLTLLHNQQAGYRFWSDDSELYNRVVIEGEEQAAPIWKENTLPNKFRNEASNAASIAAIGEKTLAISNPFFQDQATVDAYCTSYLAFFLAGKNYFSFDLPGCPIPLEVWDTVRIQERLTPGSGSGKKYGTFQYSTDGTQYGSDGVVISQRGIIRDIKVNKFTNTIVCQEVT